MTLSDLTNPMLEAAKTVLGSKFSGVRKLLLEETEKLATTLKQIIEAAAKGEISEAEAKILLNQQKLAATSVLVAAQGMTVVAVQSAIHAALSAVKETINQKAGFPLLG